MPSPAPTSLFHEEENRKVDPFLDALFLSQQKPRDSDSMIFQMEIIQAFNQEGIQRLNDGYQALLDRIERECRLPSYLPGRTQEGNPDEKGIPPGTTPPNNDDYVNIARVSSS